MDQATCARNWDARSIGGAYVVPVSLALLLELALRHARLVNPRRDRAGHSAALPVAPEAHPALQSTRGNAPGQGPALHWPLQHHDKPPNVVRLRGGDHTALAAACFVRLAGLFLRLRKARPEGKKS